MNESVDIEYNSKNGVLKNDLGHNAKFIKREVEWLQRIIQERLKEPNAEIELIQPAEDFFAGNYAQFIKKFDLDVYDRLLVILSIIPHIAPSYLKELFLQNENAKPLQFREGGTISKSGRAFLPTVETFLYIVCGDDVERRITLLKRFSKNALLFAENILNLGSGGSDNKILLNRLLEITEEFYLTVLLEKNYKPDFSIDFPAQKLETKLSWTDLVLSPTTLSQVKEIKNWIKLKHNLEKDHKLGNRMAKGFKSLFYGPPGTGKTLTACLLGNELNRDVFRIDLSMVVSKYIGETEKNLARIFDTAERKNWILFFDEADALFGQRTQVSSSNDRYANQEVSYLLQRVETFNGMIILSSNLKDNIDHAFIRRFNSIIHFPKPKEEERLLLWKSTLPKDVNLSGDIDILYIAKKYNLTGAHIENVLYRALIKMYSEDKIELNMSTIHSCIVDELMKEGITV